MDTEAGFRGFSLLLLPIPPSSSRNCALVVVAAAVCIAQKIWSFFKVSLAVVMLEDGIGGV